MRELLLVVAIIGGLSACGKDPEAAATAEPETITVTETQTLPCTVEQTESGALISCPDGTSVEVKGGHSCSADVRKGPKHER